MYYDVKYRTSNADGKQTYTNILVDAMSFTEAEGKAEQRGAEEVVMISRHANIKELDGPTELLDGNSFYACKVLSVTINGKGKPKKMHYIIVTQAPADQPSLAARRVEELMNQGYDMTLESVFQKPWEEIVTE